jgi:hypothetical protein
MGRHAVHQEPEDVGQVVQAERLGEDVPRASFQQLVRLIFPCGSSWPLYLPAVLREEPQVQVAQVPVGIGDENRGRHGNLPFDPSPITTRWTRGCAEVVELYLTRCASRLVVGAWSDKCCRGNSDAPSWSQVVPSLAPLLQGDGAA